MRKYEFAENFFVFLMALSAAAISCNDPPKNKLYSLSKMEHLPAPSADMLILAVEQGSYGSTLNLLSRGVDPNAHGRDGRTALHAFFSGKNWRQDKNLLDLLLRKGADPNVVDSNGRTPLHFAAEQNKSKLIDRLIFRNAKINAQDNEKQTPLHLAAQFDNMEIAKILIDSGADIERKDKHGKTPLALAAENKHWLTARMLLQSGADPMTEDEFGQRPIRWLAKKCFGEIAKDGELSMCLDIRSIKNATLHMAASMGSALVTNIILEHSANPSVLFKFDNNMSASGTALCAAVTNNHPGLVKLLLQHGADPNIPDANGWTPLHLAIWKNHSEMVKTLLSHGADPSTCTKSGENAYALAKDRKRKDLIRILKRHRRFHH